LLNKVMLRTLVKVVKTANSMSGMCWPSIWICICVLA